MKKIVFILFVSICLFGCHSGGKVTKRYSLSLDNAIELQGESLLTADSCHYFYDLKSVGIYLALLDYQSDTVLTLYERSDLHRPTFIVSRGRKDNQLEKPYFRKEVTADNSVFHLFDDNTRCCTLYLNDGKWHLERIGKKFYIENSFNFNQTEKELYGVPLLSWQPYPFYYYNPQKGYYWVDADSVVQQVLSSKVEAYMCNLCVNEVKDRAVAAYRFTNALSFYDLVGNVQNHITIGESFIFPLTLNTGVLDVERTPKCFLDICGTTQYVYMLYSGSADSLSHTYLLAFDWNGEHYQTWKLDRNIRTISITDDKNLYGVRSMQGGEQEVCHYQLK